MPEITERELEELLDAYFASNNCLHLSKNLIELFGTTKAVFLSDLISKDEHFREEDLLREDRYFPYSQPERQKNTGLSPHNQARAIKTFTDNGILSVKRIGLPCRQYFHINYLRLITVWNSKVEGEE